MKIWCISKYASTPNYGTGARLFYLAKEFRALGHDVTLITSDSNHLAAFPASQKTYNHEQVDGVQVCWLKTRKYKKTASISRVLSWLDFEKKLFFLDTKTFQKPDVVIVSSLSLLTVLYGLYLKRKFGVCLVFEVRDIWPLTMTEEAGFSQWHPVVQVFGVIEKLGYKYADLIVGTMPKLSLHVRTILGENREVFCSPLGFEPKKYESNSMRGEGSFEDVFPKAKVIIGYAGSMGVTNNLEAFITSIKSLKNEKNIHFMIVGGGDLKAKYVGDLEGCANVTFLSRIKQDEVKSFLSKCDVLYLSTKGSKVWSYGQSMNKVVEYMLAAKPIIASYTGYPSMINEANCGRFVRTDSSQELTNVLLEFVNMSEIERKKLGKNGKDWIYAYRQYGDLAKRYITKINEVSVVRN